MQHERPGLSVVVPVYKSARILPLLVDRLKPVLESLQLPYELILVDDASPDETGGVAQHLATRESWVRSIQLMTNSGQHNALLCGIRHATYATIVTMDDDLQHPPEEIPALLAHLDESHDVVYGTPQKEAHSLWRGLASRITKLILQHAMGAETAGRIGAFRALRTDLRQAFVAYQSSFVSIDALLTWGTRRFTSVPVRHDPRYEGTSNYTFKKLLLHAMTMITAFSAIPMRFATLVGLSTTVMGLAILLWVLFFWAHNGSVLPGFASIACMVTLFAGAQLTCLGIMGEYLARIHFRLMDRPAYTIRDTAPEAVRVP